MRLTCAETPTSTPVTRAFTIGIGEESPDSAILCRSCPGLALEPTARTGARPARGSVPSKGTSRSPSRTAESAGQAPGYRSG
ncbi:hypothetical protein RKD34_000997 [Streptomyces sp. SAI-218]